MNHCRKAVVNDCGLVVRSPKSKLLRQETAVILRPPHEPQTWLPYLDGAHRGELGMYCPNCGVENAQSQKFCRRCGANLLAAGYAREFSNEAATGNVSGQSPQTAAPAVLKVTALVSILGFLFVTIGAIILSIAQYASQDPRHGPPLGLMLAFLGYGALVLICRQLVKLATLPANVAKTEMRSWPLQSAVPPAALAYNPQVLPGHTNRNLAEAGGYHSVTEPETQQFDPARRAGQ
jgi:hypothetical protein